MQQNDSKGYQAYVRDYFAKDALTYDRRERLRRRMRERLLAAAAVQPGEQALDVCTGTGALAFGLAAAGAIVTGVDLSPEMLAKAEAKAQAAGAEIKFLLGDATALPFPDKSFDICTLSMGLHCMPPHVRQQTLCELSRLARRRVSLMEPNSPRLAVGRHLVSLLGRVQGSPQYWSDFVHTGLDGMLAAAGLELEQRFVFNGGVHMVLACRPRG